MFQNCEEVFSRNKHIFCYFLINTNVQYEVQNMYSVSE